MSTSLDASAVIVHERHPELVCELRYEGRCADKVQACRDCGELFPYDIDADRCPACVAEMVGTA